MSSELQAQIFQAIRDRLPQHLSFVDEVAFTLQISTDSAYRRIRCEKPLQVEELLALCRHFNLSMDRLLNLQSEAFLFTGALVEPGTFRFEQYLNSVGKQMAYMASFSEKAIYYLCKDIPLFHHFQFRELAAFKYYFWMKTILQAPEFAERRFSFLDYPDEMFQLGQKILACYNAFESTEFWNIESINSTIRQIEFYRDSQTIAEDDIFLLYEALERLLDHLEQQADLGYKFAPDDPAKKAMGSFAMYLNEVILGDNSIAVELNGTRAVFLTHSVINFMITRDARFCQNMFEHVHNLMKKSTLISAVSERERSRFFKNLRHRIAARKGAPSP
jgi:hypothetical protein